MKCMYPANELLMKMAPSGDATCRMYCNHNYAQSSIKMLTFKIKPEVKKPLTNNSHL